MRNQMVPATLLNGALCKLPPGGVPKAEA